MAGHSKLEAISEPDFADVLQVLSATTKGRAFLDEYRRRSRPEDTLGLIQSLAQIESTLGSVREQLQPGRIAAELQDISMTLDIALDGAEVDPEGDETARRFALADRARQELVAVAHSLFGDLAAAAESFQSDRAAEASEAR